jgi:hypothetical protein
VDAAGNAYVVGVTQSPNFPTTAGAFDRTGAASNNLDVFVAKINPTGTALVYSTFVGGTNFEWGGDRHRRRQQCVRNRSNQVLEFPNHRWSVRPDFNVDTCPRCGIDQYDALVFKLERSRFEPGLLDVPGGFDIDDGWRSPWTRRVAPTSPGRPACQFPHHERRVLACQERSF